MLSQSGIHGAITIFAALNLLDIASTSLALQVGLAEANGIPSLLLASGGEPAMYLFKAATTLLVIAAVVRLSPYYRRVWHGIRAANWLLAATVVLNLLQLMVAL